MKIDLFSIPKDRCPKCSSRNICVGAFPLSCQDCGWHYLNDEPCSVCGGPSVSMMHSVGAEVYGCKDHPISEQTADAMWARFAMEISKPEYPLPASGGAE